MRGRHKTVDPALYLAAPGCRAAPCWCSRMVFPVLPGGIEIDLEAGFFGPDASHVPAPLRDRHLRMLVAPLVREQRGGRRGAAASTELACRYLR